MKKIVSTQWLNDHLNDPNLIILDASISAAANGTAFKTYEETIPGARRFDLKNVFLDKTSPFPNTIPTPEVFERECRKIGINQVSEIIVFDNRGIYSSPRVWWLFNVMGHRNISVLNGGLPQWIKDGYRTEKEHHNPREIGDFKVEFNEALVVSFNQVVQNTLESGFTIVDARSESRFNGTGKEPRKSLKSGHIKNSINIPYQDVLENGMYKSETELTRIFEEKCKSAKDLVFSCGSGMTACIVMLAGHMAYYDSLKLYDGSWTEWAERNNLKEDI